jgi:hypothetical protein
VFPTPAWDRDNERVYFVQNVAMEPARPSMKTEWSLLIDAMIGCRSPWSRNRATSFFVAQQDGVQQ